MLDNILLSKVYYRQSLLLLSHPGRVITLCNYRTTIYYGSVRNNPPTSRHHFQRGIICYKWSLVCLRGTKTILIKIPQVYCGLVLFCAGWGLKGLMPYPRLRYHHHQHKDDAMNGRCHDAPQKDTLGFCNPRSISCHLSPMKIPICLYLICH